MDRFLTHTPRPVADRAAPALTHLRSVAEIHTAVAAAKQYKKPWCLDPVGCGGTVYRTKQAAAIMAMRPDVVRGNARCRPPPPRAAPLSA